MGASAMSFNYDTPTPQQEIFPNTSVGDVEMQHWIDSTAENAERAMVAAANASKAQQIAEASSQMAIKRSKELIEAHEMDNDAKMAAAGMNGAKSAEEIAKVAATAAPKEASVIAMEASAWMSSAALAGWWQRQGCRRTRDRRFSHDSGVSFLSTPLSNTDLLPLNGGD